MGPSPIPVSCGWLNPDLPLVLGAKIRLKTHFLETLTALCAVLGQKNTLFNNHSK